MLCDLREERVIISTGVGTSGWESGKASRRRWCLGKALRGWVEYDNAVMTGK